MEIPNNIKAKLADAFVGRGFDFVNFSNNEITDTAKIRIDDNGEVIFFDTAYPDGIKLSEIVNFRQHIREEVGTDGKSKLLKFKDVENEEEIGLTEIRNNHLNDESYEYWWSSSRECDFVDTANVHVLSGGAGLISTADSSFDESAHTDVTKGWSLSEFFATQAAVARAKNKKFSYRNFWFDVPGVYVVTPSYIANKACMIELSLPIRMRVPSKFLALRLYDATADVELTRTHIVSGVLEKDTKIIYRGELPDTDITIRQNANCDCIFDLNSQESYEQDLPTLRKNVPPDQHIIVLQFSVVDKEYYEDSSDGVIKKADSPDFYFGNGSAKFNFMGFQKFSDEYLFQQNGIYYVDGDENHTVEIKIDRMHTDNYTVAFSSNKNIDVWVESQTEEGFVMKWGTDIQAAIIDWQLNAVENANNTERLSTNHWKFRKGYFNIANVESELDFVVNNTLTGRIVGMEFFTTTPTVYATAVAKPEGNPPTAPIIKSAFPETDGSWKIEKVDDRYDYTITVEV